MLNFYQDHYSSSSISGVYPFIPSDWNQMKWDHTYWNSVTIFSIYLFIFLILHFFQVSFRYTFPRKCIARSTISATIHFLPSNQLGKINMFVNNYVHFILHIVGFNLIKLLIWSSLVCFLSINWRKLKLLLDSTTNSYHHLFKPLEGIRS